MTMTDEGYIDRAMDWLEETLRDSGGMTLVELRKMRPASMSKGQLEEVVRLMTALGGIKEDYVRTHPSGKKTVYRWVDEDATVDDDEEADDGAEPKKPDGTAGSWVDTSKAFQKGTEGAAERRVGADGASEADSEGGFAGEAEPGTVARRGAGADARGEDGGEACPHCDAPRIEVTITVRVL